MYQFIDNGTVTSVPGFTAAGIHCGIKKSKKDLAMIYSATPCSAAGTFTLNKVKAAPLLVSQKIIIEGRPVKAILVNSGNANACTGEKGYEHASETQELAAEKLGIAPHEVLISSTGVIGQFLPMEKMKSGIDQIVPRLSAEGGHDAASAIMTTDTKMKSFGVTVALAQGKISMGLIAKGSGMIMPNMATMLGFVTTDAAMDHELLQEALSGAVNQSFNKITVDGDTSTNDMVVILANGHSGIRIRKETADYELFLDGLSALCREAAKAVISDGEGATKLITITVEGAVTAEEADLVGKAIANSPLVKTAIHGEDANWGRILCAAGYSGAQIEPEKVTIYFDEVPVLLEGYHIALDEEKAKQALSKNQITIKINLGVGFCSSTWWTCDLSAEYIHINAAYRT